MSVFTHYFRNPKITIIDEHSVFNVNGNTFQGNGTLSDAKVGDIITVIAPAINKQKFVEWNITNVDIEDNTLNPLTFVMPDNDVNISAVYVPINNIRGITSNGAYFPTTDGRTSQDIVDFTEGETRQVIAVPPENKKFLFFNRGGTTDTLVDNPASFIVPNTQFSFTPVYGDIIGGALPLGVTIIDNNNNTPTGNSFSVNIQNTVDNPLVIMYNYYNSYGQAGGQFFQSPITLNYLDSVTIYIDVYGVTIFNNGAGVDLSPTSGTLDVIFESAPTGGGLTLCIFPTY